MDTQFKRILLKLSGEALGGQKGTGLDAPTIDAICKGIVKAKEETGAEIAIVVGGGNFWRGRSGGGMERTRSDQIGMLATVMNSLAVADSLTQLGCDVRVQSAIHMTPVAEPYDRNRVVRHLEKGRIVLLAGGTGNPFFSTDTAAALRAAEINADVIFKATMVDGVYDKDPKKHSDAKRFAKLSFSEILRQNLAVIDSTAATMCRDNGVSLLVFDLSNPEHISAAIQGQAVGTLVEEA